MSATLEREVKLRFDSVDVARRAVLAAGAKPFRARRLQDDCLLDTADEMLRRRRSVLRVRLESGTSFVTFKGPVQPSTTVKVREELETVVGDGRLLLRLFDELGFHAWFRYQKYREEFAIADLIVAIDETPLGIFVEIEGGDRGIREMAEALGRSPADYLLDSYCGLFARYRQERGLPMADMLFVWTEPSKNG